MQEATACQLDTDDDGSVRHHHGHRSEVYLQILWQLLAACIAWVLYVKTRFYRPQLVIMVWHRMDAMCGSVALAFYVREIYISEIYISKIYVREINVTEIYVSVVKPVKVSIAFM